MAKIAFLFPGQGAQALGMGKEAAAFPAAADLFARAGEVLGYDLLDLCLNGPEEKLHTTAVSQPALYVASLAAVEKLRQSNPQAIENCVAAAGLSLGEYTALAFAGALSFEDGLRVVKARGEAMQAAADARAGGMVAVLGIEPQKLEELCEQARGAGEIRIANFLCPGNLVVSGAKAACEQIVALAPTAGAMKTVPLTVAGAFHTSLMKPADERLAEALAGVELRAPRVPVYSNVDASPHADPDEIRGLLIKQVLEPVLWERCVRHLLADGCDLFYELGPGRVLAGLMKRIQRKAEIENVSV